MHHLKTYDNYNKIGILFKIRAATVQLYLNQMINIFSAKLYNKFVEKAVLNEIETFEFFPDVKLIIDCSVQEIPRFAVSFDENKVFFSVKHEIYCIKKEYVHLIDGIVINISDNYPGSYHDFNLFLKRLDIYKKLLIKENNIDKKFYEIMADKGYEGIQKYFPAKIPHKGKSLNSDEIKYNKKLSSHRIIVERYYGRLKCLFKAARLKVRGDLKNHHNVLKICVALTNYHIKIHPLINNDNKMLKKINLIDKKILFKTSNSQFTTKTNE